MAAMIENIAEQVGIRICDRVQLPSRQPAYLPPPDGLHEDVRSFLAQKYPDGLYRHQSRAIAAALAGQDHAMSM